MTDSDFRKFFLPYTPDFILNLFDSQTPYPYASSCPGIHYPYNLTNMVKFTFPQTCGYSNWKSSGQCLFMADFSTTFQAQIGLTLSSCPGSYFPYVSVTCNGNSCNSLLKPCDNDANCGTGLSCVPITVNETGGETNVPTEDDVFSLARSMRLYDDTEKSPGCKDPREIMTSIYDFLLKHIFDGTMITMPRTYAKICVPTTITLDSNFVTSANDSLGLDKCKIETRESGQTCNYGPDLCNVSSCYNTTCQNLTTGYYDIPCEKCNTYYSSCYHCNPYYVTSSIDCTNSFIKPFDGKSGSTDTLDAKRLNGMAFKSLPPSVAPVGDDNYVLFYSDCGGNAQILPGGNYRFKFGYPGIPTGAQFLIDRVHEIVKCRSSSISEEAINILYGIEGLLYYLTEPAPSNPPVIPDITAWFNAILNENSTFNKLEMPSTCTYDFWLKNGYCSVRYDGFISLIGLDITLSAQVIKCPSSPIPAFYLGCKGEDCFLGNKFKFCTTDKDCTKSTVCTDVFNISQYSDNSNNNNNNNSYYNDTNCYSNGNTTTCSVVSSSVDGAVSGLLAVTPAMFTSYFRDSSSCWDNAVDPFHLAKNGLRYMEGLPADMSSSNELFMCGPNPDYIKKQNTSQWAQDQVIVTGTTVKLTHLSAWNIPKGPISAGGGGGGGGGSGSSSNGVMKVIVSFTAFILGVLLM
jgi:hypothetical protein